MRALRYLAVISGAMLVFSAVGPIFTPAWIMAFIGLCIVTLAAP